MKPVVQILSLVPPAFLDRPHVVTRYLYQERKPGRLTVLFQRHSSRLQLPMDLQAYPARLDTDPEFKRREDYRVFGASYALAGSAELVNAYDGSKHRIGPGTLFQYNGQTLRELVLRAQPGFTECSVSLDGDTGRLLESLEIWRSGLITASVGLHVTVVRAYLELYAAVLDHSRTARALLGQLATLLDHAYSFVERESVESRFRSAACSLLASNVGPHYSMKRAAADLGIPYEQFRKQFRRAVGVAPVEYQIRRRMEQACVLLENHSVKQSALLLGYTDPYVFSRQFSKYTGTAPSAYHMKGSQSRDTDGTGEHS